MALDTVTTLQFLAILALVLIGGLVAERVPRRKHLLTTHAAAVRAVALGVLVTARSCGCGGWPAWPCRSG